MAKKIKEPIRLREKLLKDGSRSLYLDCWNNGRRTYEYLRLYIIPEKTRLDRERNKATIIQAESAKAKRILELQQGKYGVVANSAINKIKLSEYIIKVGEKKENKRRFVIFSEFVTAYNDIVLQKVDKRYLLGFVEYLKQKRIFVKNSRNYKTTTQGQLYALLNTVLNCAVRDGLLNVNPCIYINKDEKPSTRNHGEPTYLTMDEVRKLASNIIPRYEQTCKAFLFSCFCGLRYSDVATLRWSGIEDVGSGKLAIKKIQEKTGSIVRIPLNRNALSYLPSNRDGELVFSGLPACSTCDKQIIDWCNIAGINKHVTFHVARHTAATLWLTYGADIYTISKLLGHSELRTTQIYAKVIDKARENAVNLVPDIEMD